MKIKYLFLAMTMTVATSASAQFVSGGGSKGGSKISSSELDPKAHFMADFRIGSVASAGGFGINLGGTKELATFSGCTLAWDFLNVEFAAPFNSPSNTDFLSLKTGLRLFSPSFVNDNLRIYTNLAMGYTCVLTKGIGGINSNWKKLLAAYADDNISDREIEKLMKELGYDPDDEDLWDELEDYYEDFDDDVIPSISTKMQANHGFGLTWGVGVQIKKKFNIGYTLQYETAFKTKNHFATFGITF